MPHKQFYTMGKRGFPSVGIFGEGMKLGFFRVSQPPACSTVDKNNYLIQLSLHLSSLSSEFLDKLKLRLHQFDLKEYHIENTLVRCEEMRCK